MKEIESPQLLAEFVLHEHCAGRTVGFVPTMGYLHAGHLKLLEVCRAENDVVVLSVYVNPAQFGPNEDFGRYPRSLDRDRELAETAGVDALFLPSDAVMYPAGLEGQQVWVDPGSLTHYVEGDSRPGHFRGVATVVAKLFAMVKPDRAYFGQKDVHQAALVRQLSQDLAMGVEVRIVPTVREPDGLALSSRNTYLTSDERAEAVALKIALDAGANAFSEGTRDAARIESIARGVLQRKVSRGRVDYVAVSALQTMEPLKGQVLVEAVLSLAVYFGSTRLIDNVILEG